MALASAGLLQVWCCGGFALRLIGAAETQRTSPEWTWPEVLLQAGNSGESHYKSARNNRRCGPSADADGRYLSPSGKPRLPQYSGDPKRFVSLTAALCFV